MNKWPVMLLGMATLAALACGSPEPDLPLLDAVYKQNIEVVRDHIESGTDLNKYIVPSGVPFEGASALHLAVLTNNVEITRLLLDNGANIERKATDSFESTPLIWAAFWGARETTVQLVEAGADVEAIDNFGTTPLGAAGADNPFILVGDLERFIEDRGFIKEYLRGLTK